VNLEVCISYKILILSSTSTFLVRLLNALCSETISLVIISLEVLWISREEQLILVFNMKGWGFRFEVSVLTRPCNHYHLFRPLAILRVMLLSKS
jgi:hypothetical protein